METQKCGICGKEFQIGETYVIGEGALGLKYTIHPMCRVTEKTETTLNEGERDGN